MTDRTIILASASPRRAALLRQIGVTFRMQPADIDESLRPGETPVAYVERMALEKTTRGAELAHVPGALVIGSDTSVVLGEQILGKPADAADAERLLVALGGQTHQVLTAVAVTDGERTATRLSATDVTMRPISAAEARAYWATGEPADKAGAYGIQGLGALFISRIEGSYSGVMGLPLYETADLLAAFGYLVSGRAS